MKKWLLTLSLPALLCAQDFYGPLGMGGCWEFGGEALYWRACTPALDLGTAKDSFLTAKSDWELGFRVFGAYYSDSCCSFVQLDWTYFRDTDTDFTKTAPGTTSLFFFDDTDVVRVSGKIHTKYNRVNLRGARYLHRGCDIGFYVYGGGRYLDLKKMLITFVKTDTGGQSLFSQKARYSGGGAELGIGTVYQLVGNLGLKAELGAIAALGEQKLHILTNTNGVKRRIRFGNRTHCVLGVDWKAGLQLSGRLTCFLITAEVGYEVNYYFDPISVAVNKSLERQAQNLGFSGPYASLSLRF